MRALALSVLQLLVAATAHADTLLELPNTKAQLELPDKWQRVDTKDLVAHYEHPSGSMLLVLRNDAPNPDMWSAPTPPKQRYVDGIERGVREATPGYRLVRKKLGTAAGVPVFDLESTGKDGTTYVYRFLLFRTYSMTLSIKVPKKGDVAVARAIATKFSPPPEKK